MAGDENKRDKLCPRNSVGAIIKKDDKYLALYRKVFPKGLAFIAGHMEEGEEPEDSLKREVKEESGLIVKDCKLVLHDIFPNPCKGGYNEHKWWVYEINSWEGEPELMEANKHEFVKFMQLAEIASYAEKNDFDPAWLDHILPTLKLLPFK